MSERRIVVIRSNGHFVKRVDAKTRTATDENQQFIVDGDRLRILQRCDWIDEPFVMDVDSVTVR